MPAISWDQIASLLSPSGQAPGAGVPEWEGWLALGTLLILFAGVIWWLFLSPIESSGLRSVRPSGGLTLSARAYPVLGALVLLSGVLFVVGIRWDEVWHRLYGGFGDDFLWPPHLMMYGALGLNSAFAGFGLAMVGRGSGGIRDRFRANPLVGLLGLLSAYQLASIPSDLLWHKIIGPDISAWSLPHVLLEMSSSAVWLIGLALLLSNTPRPRFQSLRGLRPAEVAAIVLVLVSIMALLQFGVTEWEWGFSSFGSLPYGRPIWVYPVVVLVVGIAEVHLVLYGLRRVGAATLLAVAACLAQLAFVTYARTILPPGPVLASHLLLVLPAVALDLFYANAVRFAPSDPSQGISFTLRLAGAAVYGLVFLVVAIATIGSLMPYPTFDLPSIVATVALGVPAGLLVALGMSGVASWLGTVAGRRPIAAQNAAASRLAVAYPPVVGPPN